MMKIVNFKAPRPVAELGTVTEIGFFTLEGTPDTYYRFEYNEQGNAILEEDFFANDQPEFEKRKVMSKDSSKYKEIQKLLTDYLKKD